MTPDPRILILAAALAPAAFGQDGSENLRRQNLTPLSEAGYDVSERNVAPRPNLAPGVRVSTGTRPAPTRTRSATAFEASSFDDPTRHGRLHFDVDLHGAQWVRGKNYKASAHAAGFEFIPFLGSDAPRNFPVAFRLETVQRGSEAIELAAEASVSLEGERYVLDRGAVEVRYDVALESVEQSFLLDLPNGTGDLVLTLDVETELACASNGAGFQFTGDFGGVQYGAAIAFDASGRRVDVPARWLGDGLELRVPSAFLADAVGPILVDPVLTPIQIDNISADLRRPDLAYEAVRDAYLFVYEEQFSGGDVDVYSFFVDAATQVTSDGAYIDSSSDSWIRPKVATRADNSRHMIVATADTTGTGENDIVARFRNASNGALDPAFTLKGHTSSYDCLNPVVGGDNFSGPSLFCVAYNRDWGTDQDVWAIIVDTDGNWVGSEIGLETSATIDSDAPAISRSTGDPGASTRFCLAWDEFGTVNSDYRVRAAQLTWDGAMTFGPFELTPWGTATSYFDVDVSCLSNATIAGEQAYLVTYDDGASIVTDAFVAVCSGDTHHSTTLLTVAEHSPQGPNHDDVRIATHETYFSLFYSQGNDLFATIVQLVEDRIGITERRIGFHSGNPVLGTLAAATAFEGGGTFSDGLVAFQENDGTSDDIFASYFYPDSMLEAAGYQYCFGVPNSTGDHGFLQAFGNRSTGSLQLLRSSRLPNSSFGFFITSTAVANVPMAGTSIGTLCVGGSVGRFGIYNSGGTGEGFFNVNPGAIAQPTGTVAAIAGQRWRFQSWHRDVATGGGTTSNFTNAVTIPFL